MSFRSIVFIGFALLLLLPLRAAHEPGTQKPLRAPVQLKDWTNRCIAHGGIYSKCIALTFDDGPNPDTTPDILRILAKYNAKGTFFLIGWRVVKFPELAKRILDEGNEIGNHSFTHPNMLKLSKDQIFKEYSDCSQAIQQATGFSPTLCRPPGGQANKLVIDVGGALGMKSVAWSMNVADFDSQDADIIQERIDRSAQSGEIVLLHDKVYATIMCLDDMLRSLQAQGYRFVTVSELMEGVDEADNRKFVPKEWLK